MDRSGLHTSTAAELVPTLRTSSLAQATTQVSTLDSMEGVCQQLASGPKWAVTPRAATAPLEAAVALEKAVLCGFLAIPTITVTVLRRLTQNLKLPLQRRDQLSVMSWI